jgi:hypothetical protein
LATDSQEIDFPRESQFVDLRAAAPKSIGFLSPTSRSSADGTCSAHDFAPLDETSAHVDRWRYTAHVTSDRKGHASPLG